MSLVAPHPRWKIGNRNAKRCSGIFFKQINICNGWYCDSFKPNNPNSHKMWTENYTRWFKAWGGEDPHRTAEDNDFSVAWFFPANGTFQIYYMYHGGTNFGGTSGSPYIVTIYDYNAPLDEYGNLNQPKYGPCRYGFSSDVMLDCLPKLSLQAATEDVVSTNKDSSWSVLSIHR